MFTVLDPGIIAVRPIAKNQTTGEALRLIGFYGEEKG